MTSADLGSQATPADCSVRLADSAEMAVAVEIAREGAALALAWFENPDLAVTQKPDGSPVSNADRDTETLLRERLREAFPGDAIIGEEHGELFGTSGRAWVIDPIDGTKAFTQGVPLFATLVALVDDSGPAIGVIALPALSETVWAGRGLGVYRNAEPCHVSNRRNVVGAYLSTSGTDYWPPEALAAVLTSRLHVRTWGDAYGYALVATGRAEAMVDPLANPWDLAAVAVIITEAGGTFSSFDGTTGPDTWRSGSGVATNGHLHESVLGLWRASSA